MRALLLFALLTIPATAQRYQASRSATGADQRVQLIDAEALRVMIAPGRGAELCGVEVRFAGAWRELLYRACDYTPAEGWTGRAPWLWPATARNFPKDVRPTEEAAGSSYDYKGKRYRMPLHGFARDLAWNVDSVSADGSGARAMLSLVDSPRTREMYPFGWRVELEYTVTDAQLSMEMRVRASEQNSDEMFFSAGNHITFRVPLVEGSDPLKTTLQSPSTIEYLKNGFMPTGHKRQRSLGLPVPLKELPVKQAVTLGGYPDGIWMALTDPAGLAVLLEHTPSAIPTEACLFNMWGDVASGYFSPEPWVGMQNSFVSGSGLLKLKPGGEWRWRLQLSYLDLTRGRRPEVPAL